MANKLNLCDECHGTGIVGDEGPGLRNSRHEWRYCEECEVGKTLSVTACQLRREAIQDAYALAADLRSLGITSLDRLATLAESLLSYLKSS